MPVIAVGRKCLIEKGVATKQNSTIKESKGTIC